MPHTYNRSFGTAFCPYIHKLKTFHKDEPMNFNPRTYLMRIFSIGFLVSTQHGVSDHSLCSGGL